MITIFILQTRAVWIAIFVSLLFCGILVYIINKKMGLFHFHRKTLKSTIIIFSIFFVMLFAGSIFIPGFNPVQKVSGRLNTIFDSEFTSNEWRIEMWEATTNLIKDNPVAGVGGGNWKISIYPYYSEYLPSVYRHWRSPHNDYLSVLAEKGIIGLLSFVILFSVLIFYCTRILFKSENKKRIWIILFMLFGIIGYVIISFFSFPNERINHLIFFSLITGVIISEYVSTFSQNMKKYNLKIKFLFIPALIILYLTIHFGFICINSELNLTKAQAAKKAKDWDSVEYYAGKAYSYFAPIEPTFSFPVPLYQGLAKFNKGKYKEALIYFKKSYKQHPTNISILNNIGSVYGQMGMLDSSIVYHRKTLDIFPHYEFGLLNLSKSYYLKKDYSRAYQVVLCCDPKSFNGEVEQVRNAIETKLD